MDFYKEKQVESWSIILSLVLSLVMGEWDLVTAVIVISVLKIVYLL